jgi:hypothetical protein
MMPALWTIRAIDYLAGIAAFVAELAGWTAWWVRGAR